MRQCTTLEWMDMPDKEEMLHERSLVSFYARRMINLQEGAHLFFFINIYLFIWLRWVLVVGCKIFISAKGI